ncbi:MAG: ArsR family transcriptional regulator [Thermoprotei archaeon]|nr:MAG: ArsR family transcriptional regulator [Thermoprotei archaeon]
MLEGKSLHEIEIKSLKKLMEVLSLLANEHRLKIIAMLAEKPMYISEIQRKLKVSYALTHLYMSSLEKMGLVESSYETVIGERPHVRKYYKLRPFKLVVSSDLIKKLVEES